MNVCVYIYTHTPICNFEALLQNLYYYVQLCTWTISIRKSGQSFCFQNRLLPRSDFNEFQILQDGASD